MSTHDTDPQRSSLLAGLADTTEPGPPPEATGTDPSNSGADSRLAASLLADLAKAPLPTEGVRETEGHSAAAVAIGAHRPPRPTDDGTIEPAVLLNTTEPLPVPIVIVAGPGAAQGPGGRRSVQQYSTVPSARTHRRQTVAVGIVIAIAVLAAGLVVALVPREQTPPPIATPSATAVAPTPAPIVMTASAAAIVAMPVASVTPRATAVAAAATQVPTASTMRAPATVPTPSVAPRAPASAPRIPHSSSGGFEEPARNF
jgi:hypothetical protein